MALQVEENEMILNEEAEHSLELSGLEFSGLDAASSGNRLVSSGWKW